MIATQTSARHLECGGLTPLLNFIIGALADLKPASSRSHSKSSISSVAYSGESRRGSAVRDHRDEADRLRRARRRQESVASSSHRPGVAAKLCIHRTWHDVTDLDVVVTHFLHQRLTETIETELRSIVGRHPLMRIRAGQ